MREGRAEGARGQWRDVLVRGGRAAANGGAGRCRAADGQEAGAEVSRCRLHGDAEPEENTGRRRVRACACAWTG